MRGWGAWDDQRVTLAQQAGPCPRCGVERNDLALVYYQSPDATWAEMWGMAGRLAVCDPCHEQVALLIEEQN